MGPPYILSHLIVKTQLRLLQLFPFNDIHSPFQKWLILQMVAIQLSQCLPTIRNCKSCKCEKHGGTCVPVFEHEYKCEYPTWPGQYPDCDTNCSREWDVGLPSCYDNPCYKAGYICAWDRLVGNENGYASNYCWQVILKQRSTRYGSEKIFLMKPYICPQTACLNEWRVMLGNEFAIEKKYRLPGY